MLGSWSRLEEYAAQRLLPEVPAFHHLSPQRGEQMC